MLYADTSALTKLVLDERESEAFRAYVIDRERIASSALVITELVRATHRIRPDLDEEARAIVAELTLINVDRAILDVAAALLPPELRALDAIHIASALALAEELDAVVTYDARMAEAARAAGLRVEAPE